MGFIELFLVAIGLSMDAFAVAICQGLNMRKADYVKALVIALFFGVFQGLMPVIGWFLGTQFESYITSIDHWIAFVLLGFIGGKMIWDALRNKSTSEADCPSPEASNASNAKKHEPLSLKNLLVLAVATSIDALAVGITFAFLRVDIVGAALTICVTTLILSFIGVLIGNRFGRKFEKKASIVGGVVLILIGLKILLEHLGIIG